MIASPTANAFPGKRQLVLSCCPGQHDVGAQPSTVIAKAFNCPVRRDEQVQHIEPGRTGIGDQPGVITGLTTDDFRRLGRVPPVAGHQRYTAGTG